MSQNTPPITTNLVNSVPLKNSLKKFIKISTLTQSIINELKLINNYKNIPIGSKLLELIEHITQIVENNSSSKYTNDDKKQIIINVLQAVFPEINIQQIENQLEYFIDNNIITKISICSKYYKSIKTFVIKKISP
jgi:hypothetical protein